MTIGFIFIVLTYLVHKSYTPTIFHTLNEIYDPDMYKALLDSDYRTLDTLAHRVDKYDRTTY